MKRKRVAALMAVMVLVMPVGGCSFAPDPITRTAVAMDTVVSLTVYDAADEEAVDICFDQIAFYERLFSRTDPASEIARLNTAQGEEVPLSPATRELLLLGKAYGEQTDGALDITIGAVSALWDFHAQTVPDAAEVDRAVQQVNYQALVVTEEGAQLPAGMQVDLGGIAKGYVADKLAQVLRDRGVASALIDLGGNIYALGDKAGEPFTVGIRDPWQENALVATVEVRDMSVVTSGVYERAFVYDGVTYHHLLDPATGWPADNGLVSVTIVSPDSAQGDALSTACFVMGLERGMALIESLPDVQALFITSDGTLHPTSGMKYKPL